MLSSLFSVFSMEWAEYEMKCLENDKEPTYEEYEYLCTDGATDYGYDDTDILDLLHQTENSSE